MLDAKLLPSTVGSVFSTAYRRSVLLATVLVLALLVPQQAYCEQETPTSCLKKFHSRNFELLTDLDATDARQRLQLMEKVLSLASNYWGHRLHHPIECYLVHDLTRWTDHQFPSPVARRVLEHLGGGTDLKPPRLNSRDSLSSIIYATSKAGIVEHEVVHAYCFQVFGHGGPDWYREGMAEVFAQQITGKTTRATQRESLRLLRLSPRVSAEQIVAESLFADKLRDSVHRDNAVADPSAALTTTTSTDLANETAAWHWTAADAQHLQQAQLAYTKSWALCQLLHQNDRYRERFRVLGKQWLAGSLASFEECFGAACPQIDFELAQLIKNYDHGYRADLTSWSWSASARPLAVGESTTVRISAHRGYQPTRINMKVDEEYQIVADGTWRLSSEASLLDASGDSSGRGQLEAVVYRNYQLSTPDPLPVGVNWSSPQEGQLFLRCHDAWHKLSDNRGSMSVRVVRIR